MYQNIALEERLDKWLWAARFFKTRALAKEAIEKGNILVNGLSVKASKDVRENDRLEIKKENVLYVGTIVGLSEHRLSAKMVPTLFEEDDTSIKKREEIKELNWYLQDPAQDRLRKGRPVKKEGRALRKLRGF